MIDNQHQNELYGRSVAVCDPSMACLLFARDVDDASMQCSVLEEHGIFAQVGHSAAVFDPSEGLGVPIIVAPADQERANMILASMEAVGADDEDDDLADDDFDGDADDDDLVDDDADDDFDDDEDDLDDEV